MSILYKNEDSYLISHEKYINEIYKSINYTINPNVFNINTKYKKSKSYKKKIEAPENSKLLEDIQFVKAKFEQFLNEYNRVDALDLNESDNTRALEIAERIYSHTSQCLPDSNIQGGNNGNATTNLIHNTRYLFPENCRFYCKNVLELEQFLSDSEIYDLIVLDPPWWNKYIRRKRKKSGDGYDMLWNVDLKAIPIQKLLNRDGLVVIWCTNSLQNLNELICDILPHWKLRMVTKWCWLKVTKYWETICDFHTPPGKQPFEQVIIAENISTTIQRDFGSRKLLISIPSAIHSHKPPLLDVLRPYLPANAKCLELFARYLLPNVTSVGNEVIRLQHECLYCENNDIV